MKSLLLAGSLALLTLSHVLLAAEIPPGNAVVYKTVGTRELKLFIDKPVDWNADGKLPAVDFFFGGGWVAGSPGQFKPQSEYLTTRGVIGVRVEYRVIPKGDAGPPTICIHDAK